jgi:DNA-directed RNA polymerase subunit RPC12/RpoP
MMADYKRQWDRLHRLRRIGMVVLIGYLPAMTCAMVATEGKPGRAAILFGVFVAWTVLFVGVAYPVSTFKCSRCGEQFLPSLWRRRDVITRRAECVHCGLHENSKG